MSNTDQKDAAWIELQKKAAEKLGLIKPDSSENHSPQTTQSPSSNT